MIPIPLFQSLITDLTIRPFRFLPVESQSYYRRQLAYFVVYFRAYLFLKKLRPSVLGEVLEALTSFSSNEQIKEDEELLLIQAIKIFLDFYREVDDKKLSKEINETSLLVNNLYKVAQEHSFYLKKIKEQTFNLTAEETRQHDCKLLTQEASFYLLEYYLQMYFGLTHANNQKIAEDLIKAKEVKFSKGVLMGLHYEIFSREFLTVLAYQIYDEKLRESLLEIYYDFKEQLSADDYELVIKNYRIFVHKLLQVLGQYEVKKISSIIYSPYGENPEVAKLLQSI